MTRVQFIDLHPAPCTDNMPILFPFKLHEVRSRWQFPLLFGIKRNSVWFHNNRRKIINAVIFHSIRKGKLKPIPPLASRACRTFLSVQSAEGLGGGSLGTCQRSPSNVVWTGLNGRRGMEGELSFGSHYFEMLLQSLRLPMLKTPVTCIALWENYFSISNNFSKY